jgi:hypothetical protein
MAKKAAACAGSSTNNENCACQKKLATECAKCDICKLLSDSYALSVVRQAIVMCGQQENAAGCSDITTYKSGKHKNKRMRIRGDLCDEPTAVSTLAEVIVHESVHLCAELTGKRTNDDPGQCSPDTIVRTCLPGGKRPGDDWGLD